MPRGEVAFDRRGDVLHSRLAAYRRLQPTSTSTTVPGGLASLGSFLLGRDDVQYFDALGAELVVQPPGARTQWYDLRLYTERQRAAQRNTHFSFAHGINSNNRFPENFVADAADQVGARLRLRRNLGRNPAAPRAAAELSLNGETGDYTVIRPEALLRISLPLPLELALGVEGAAGTVESSEIPAQALCDWAARRHCAVTRAMCCWVRATGAHEPIWASACRRRASRCSRTSRGPDRAIRSLRRAR